MEEVKATLSRAAQVAESNARATPANSTAIADMRADIQASFQDVMGLMDLVVQRQEDQAADIEQLKHDRP